MLLLGEIELILSKEVYNFMRPAFFILLTSALIIVVCKPQSVRSQTSDAPFLYYYSSGQATLIIERADGSDSRVLFHNSDEDASENIWGPSWSPSAKWFAWVNQSSARTPPDTNPVFVVSSDGQTQHSLLGDLGVVRFVEWSPTSDMLVIGLLVIAEGQYVIDVYIVDVESQKIINTLRTPELNFGGVNWSPDGEFVILYQYPPYTPNLWNENLPTVVLLSLSGEQEDISVSVPVDCFDVDLKAAFSNTNIVYRLKDTVVIRNLRTSEEKAINFPDQVIRSIEWSFDESYALIYSQASCDSIEYRLWLLSPQEARVDFIAENVDLPFYLNGVRPWSWSPSENIGLFYSNEAFFLLVASQRMAQSIVPSNESLQTYYTHAQWLPDGSGPILLYELPSQTSALYKYEVTSGEQILFGPATGELREVRNFVISPNGRYIVFSSICKEWEHSVCFLDLLTNEFFLSLHQSDAGDVAEFYWHPTQDWVIIAQWLDASTKLVSLSKPDGTLIRELTTCTNSNSCFGWMPN